MFSSTVSSSRDLFGVAAVLQLAFVFTSSPMSPYNSASALYSDTDGSVSSSTFGDWHPCSPARAPPWSPRTCSPLTVDVLPVVPTTLMFSPNLDMAFSHLFSLVNSFICFVKSSSLGSTNCSIRSFHSRDAEISFLGIVVCHFASLLFASGMNADIATSSNAFQSTTCLPSSHLLLVLALYPRSHIPDLNRGTVSRNTAAIRLPILKHRVRILPKHARATERKGTKYPLLNS
mmetsp:Transcript_38891/g.93554  ORF Transcript_38891/g.93554 Transcript_38891/m.93554 type:complete len:232 (+) Transcript_38891:166-861(+)